MEQPTISGLAQQYRDEGYDVVVHPQGDDLPPFLAGFEPDLIARRGREGVVVEAKRNRGELAKDADVVRLAEVLDDRPGWRLDLILLESEDRAERAARSASAPSDEQLNALLATAEDLAARGQAGLGCVAAWSALEAALRRPAASSTPNGTTPAEQIRALYSHGALSRAEFDRLREAERARPRVEHGWIDAAVDPSLVADVAAIVRRLAGL